MAVACLLAVLLLQAPFARAAWLSSSMACCMSDHCPVQSHHHKAATTTSEMPMDCGHNMTKMANCKISCCNSSDETAINVAQFLIPALQSLDSPERIASANIKSAPQLLSRSEKPQSPPPRNTLS